MSSDLSLDQKVVAFWLLFGCSEVAIFVLFCGLICAFYEKASLRNLFTCVLRKSLIE